jgi:hypothetical protein
VLTDQEAVGAGVQRLKEASAAAALIYQHAADERDSEIARALDEMMGPVPAPNGARVCRTCGHPEAVHQPAAPAGERRCVTSACTCPTPA